MSSSGRDAGEGGGGRGGGGAAPVIRLAESGTSPPPTTPTSILRWALLVIKGNTYLTSG